MTNEYQQREAASVKAWDAGIRILQSNRLGDTDELHVDRLLELMNIPMDSNLIDLGCGFGEVARLMIAARPDLDISCVTNSRVQYVRIPEDPRMPRYLMDFHKTGYDDGVFDAAMLHYSLCHADLQLIMAEAHRIVRPGGMLHIYDYERTGGDNQKTIELLDAQFHQHHTLARVALKAGWFLVTKNRMPKEDQLFKRMFTPADYAAIFNDLEPTYWRFMHV